MSFTNTRGRYASFGVATSLPGDVIDLFWYIIDNNLKGVFELDSLLTFKLLNDGGFLSIDFSEESANFHITFDFPMRFDPFYPKEVFVRDQDGHETVLLPDEHFIF